jgi:hypothetical protein
LKAVPLIPLALMGSSGAFDADAGLVVAPPSGGLP